MVAIAQEWTCPLFFPSLCHSFCFSREWGGERRREEKKGKGEKKKNVYSGMHRIARPSCDTPIQDKAS